MEEKRTSASVSKCSISPTHSHSVTSNKLSTIGSLVRSTLNREPTEVLEVFVTDNGKALS
jgi:hypothetical protein